MSAALVAARMDVELIANEARRAERTPNPDSMDLYFRGMYWFNKGRYAENMPDALGFFERALALDPGNLDALLGTAVVDMQVAAGYQADDRPVRFAAVEATLTKVLPLRAALWRIAKETSGDGRRFRYIWDVLEKHR